MLLRPSQPSPVSEIITFLFCLGVSILMLSLPDGLQITIADRLSVVLTTPYWEVRNFGEDVLAYRQDKAWVQARLTELQLDSLRHVRSDGLRREQAAPASFVGSLQPCQVLARRLGRQATMIKIRSPEPVRWQLFAPVMTSSGLIGRIRRPAGPHAAWVELLTAPDMALGCEVDGKGIVGVLRPLGAGFTLEMVGRDEGEIEVGDKVVTSGIAELSQDSASEIGWGLMPRGLPVGRITKIERPAARLFLSIEVEPSAGFRRNERVFVVKNEGSPPAGGDGEVAPDGGGDRP